MSDREPGPLPRKVHVMDREWQYQVAPGRRVVKIRSPMGEDKVIGFNAILGINYHEFNSRWESGEKFEITPGLVKRYISKFF